MLETNKALVRRYYEEVLEQRDMAVLTAVERLRPAAWVYFDSLLSEPNAPRTSLHRGFFPCAAPEVAREPGAIAAAGCSAGRGYGGTVRTRATNPLYAPATTPAWRSLHICGSLRAVEIRRVGDVLATGVQSTTVRS